jgi:hypothetical protein
MLAILDDYSSIKNYMRPDRDWIAAYEEWDNHAASWKPDQNGEWVSLRDVDIKYGLLQAGCLDKGMV